MNRRASQCLTSDRAAWRLNLSCMPPLTTPGDTPTTSLAPPSGGVDSGGGPTSGIQRTIMLIGGFSLLAAGAIMVRRRFQGRRLD